MRFPLGSRKARDRTTPVSKQERTGARRLRESDGVQEALLVGLENRFAATKWWHVLGTLATGPALIILVWSHGSHLRLLIWLALHLCSCAAMALAYRFGPQLPRNQRVVHGASVTAATYVNGFVMGAAAWFDLGSMRTDAYALGVCASLLAFAAGTLVNLNPLVRLIYATLVPMFTMLIGALMFAEQYATGAAVAAFATIVVSRPLELSRRSFEELVALREEANATARRDELTGLLNRRGFLTRVQELMKSQTGGAMFFIDIDDFKSINDSLGHQVGDGLLTSAATRIVGRLDRSSSVGRLGGDEIVAFVPDADVDAAPTIARRISSAFADDFSVDGHQVSVSASVGFTCRRHPATTALELLDQADQAMYDAKKSATSIATYEQLQFTHDDLL